MKLIATVKGERSEIEISRKHEKVFAEIDGRKYELEAQAPETNVYLLKSGETVYEVFIDPGQSSDGPLLASVRGDEFEIELSDSKSLRGTLAGSASADGTAEVKTAMPGKVVKVLLDVGSEVEKGDGVVVVEAMKMQNEMKATKDGVVKEIRFSEGDTVNAGDILVVIK